MTSDRSAETGHSWLPIAVDVAIVAALAVATYAIGADHRDDVDALTLALVVLPLLARRSWPLPVLALVAFGAVVTAALVDEPWVQVIAVAIASFTFGERSHDRTTSALTIAVIVVAMGFGLVVQEADPLEALVLTFVIVVPTWVAGDLVRSRRLEAAQRLEALERSLREREASLVAAAAEERRHVARELHDVVAHAVSVMVIQ